jgi:integrase
MHSTVVKGQKGIRRKPSGKYLAAKSIKGKKFYKEFETLREATNWKNQFHPLIAPNPIPAKNNTPAFTAQSNGRDRIVTFGEVWERYQRNFLKTLSAYTQYKKLLRMAKFLPNLSSVPMAQMSPDVITQHIEDMILITPESSKRCNFDKELKDLNSVFAWYAEFSDFTFHSPVKRFHFKLAKIKDIEPKKKDMSVEQFSIFLEALNFQNDDDGFMFQSLAMIQTYLAGRIQEAAALNDRTVDFHKKRISISEKIVWMKGKPEHKFETKTGSKGIALVEMNEDMLQRLQKLKSMRPKGCKYYFHRRGKPLRYNLILKRYNEALIRAGLEEFSGTNILRHTMATLSRKIAGLDASQAMLRHTTARMSEGYAKLDVNEKVSSVVIQAEELFRKAKVTREGVQVTRSYQVTADEI